MSAIVKLLRELVAASSVSLESNRGVIAVAQRALTGAGWSFEEHCYLDANGTRKTNLIAWPGAAESHPEAFHLALVCHTDTVPYGSWGDALNLVEDSGRLKGCGACDVKGYLACILTVAAQLDRDRISRPLAIVLTADEEVGCVGARSLVEANAFTCDHAIVGEPTSLHAVRAGKGYCLAEITVTGREAHSAFPGKGVSAIYGAAGLIVEIEKIAAQLKKHRVSGFEPAWTTINIGEIHGGLAKNIVAPSCRFLLEWRPVPGQDPNTVAGLVRAEIARMAQADSSFKCELKVLRTQEGFALREDSPLLQSVLRASGNPASSVAFGTEAPWMNRLGAEALVFGPGSMESAHSPREFVPIEELFRCVDVLTEVVYELCG